MPQKQNTPLEEIVSRKHYFIDTNCLIISPWSIFKLASCSIPKEIIDPTAPSYLSSIIKEINSEIKEGTPNTIYISQMVEDELDSKKGDIKADPGVRIQASMALNVLTKIRNYGAEHNQSIYEGITLPNRSVIKLVPFDEEKFLNENKNLYKPNNDTRIVDNYFNRITEIMVSYVEGKEKQRNPLLGIVKKTIRDFRKNILKQDTLTVYKTLIQKYKCDLDKQFQIVSEDHGVEKKSIDMSSKMFFMVGSNPLLFERTKDTNPAASYTGIFPTPMILSNDAYEKLIDIGNKQDEFTIDQLRQLALKADLNLEEVLTNQFLLIRPESAGTQKILEYYLRKTPREGQFKRLVHYRKFDNEEYGNVEDAPVQSIKPTEATIEHLGEHPATIKYVLRRMSDFGIITKKEREYQKNQIDAGEQQKEHVLRIIKSKLSHNKLQEILGDQFMGKQKEVTSGGGLLARPFNPEIRPRGKQILMVDNFQNPRMGLASVVADMGKGKTYWALGCGVKQVRDHIYEKIVYIRQPVETGKELGFMPGGLESKTEHYMIPCQQSLLKLFGIFRPDSRFYERHPEFRTLSKPDMIAQLQQRGLLEYAVPNFIPGTTYDNCYIIVDEAHQFNREQMKLILGRIGMGSKMILLGDYSQFDAMSKESMHQIGVLTPRKAGISHIIQAIPYKKNLSHLYGHVSIIEAEGEKHSDRSEVATIGSEF